MFYLAIFRYPAIFCLLAIFVGCPSPLNDGDRSREVAEAFVKKRKSGKEAKRTKRFHENLINNYKLFVDSVNEENHIKLEIVGKTLSRLELPDGVKQSLGANHQTANKRINDLGADILEFTTTFRRTIADRTRKEAGAKEYLKEEDLIPKIEEIRGQFKQLNEEFQLGIEF